MKFRSIFQSLLRQLAEGNLILVCLLSPRSTVYTDTLLFVLSVDREIHVGRGKISFPILVSVFLRSTDDFIHVQLLSM